MLGLRSTTSVPAWITGCARAALGPALLRSFANLMLAAYLVAEPSNRISYLAWCLLAAALVAPWLSVVVLSLTAGRSRLLRRAAASLPVIAAAAVGVGAGRAARAQDHVPTPMTALLVVIVWVTGIAVARILERRGVDARPQAGQVTGPP